jgi:protein disulfide-isomerase
MKRLLVALISGCVLANAIADEAGWLTDLPKAQAKAKAENKLVLMDFNGSDWCPPCKALRKNVLSSKEFVDYAKDKLILVDVDFPRSIKQPEELQKANAELAKKFGIDGYPTIIVLGSDGKELKRDVGYGGQSTKEFIADLEKARKKS